MAVREPEASITNQLKTRITDPSLARSMGMFTAGTWYSIVPNGQPGGGGGDLREENLAVVILPGAAEEEGDQDQMGEELFCLLKISYSPAGVIFLESIAEMAEMAGNGGNATAGNAGGGGPGAEGLAAVAGLS